MSIEEFLDRHARIGKTIKTSFNLQKMPYERLKKFCDENQMVVSELIDALIINFLEGYVK